MTYDTRCGTSSASRVQEKGHVYRTEEDGPPSDESQEVGANEDVVGEGVVIMTESGRKPGSDASIDNSEEY